MLKGAVARLSATVCRVGVRWFRRQGQRTFRRWGVENGVFVQLESLSFPFLFVYLGLLRGSKGRKGKDV